MAKGPAHALAGRQLGPGFKQIDGSLEAQSFEGYAGGGGGFQHQSADQIVGDGMHPQLAFDHRGGECAQHIQTEVGLDLTIVKFDLPTQSIQLGDPFVGKGGVIKKRGGDHNGAGAIPTCPTLKRTIRRVIASGTRRHSLLDTPFLRCPRLKVTRQLWRWFLPILRLE